MNDAELESEIKNLFINKLTEVVTDDAYNANPDLPKITYLESIYTDIMALGYNNLDIKRSTDDLYEMKTIIYEESEELYNNLQKRILETLHYYPKLINVFIKFNEIRMVELDNKKIYSTIKTEFESI